MTRIGPLDYTRQLDLLDPAELAGVHVDVVGLGGIGSPTGLALAKMGCADLRAIDMDRVEAVNLSTQLYRRQDAADGVWKAHACRQIWHDFAGIDATAVVSPVAAVSLRGIVVTGVDSMATRQSIWEQVLATPAVEWLIDGRMGATDGTIRTVRMAHAADRRLYEPSLYDDATAVALPCTGRAVIWNTLWLAALLARQVALIVMGPRPPERRIEFDLANLALLVEE